MSDINLLQNVNSPQDEGGDGAGSYLNYVGVGIFVIVLAVTFILYYASNKAQAQLDDLSQGQITAKNTLVAEDGYSRFIKEQDNMKFLQYLIPNHIDWSFVTPKFSSVTLKTVTYISLVVNQNGMVSISGEAPNFAELDKYLKVLSDKTKSPFIESVDLKSVSPSTGATAGVSFSINLIVNQQLWNQNTTK